MGKTLAPADFREIRETLGLSQGEMALALRLTGGSRAVRRFELGEREPGGPTQYLYELFRDGVIQPTTANWRVYRPKAK